MAQSSLMTWLKTPAVVKQPESDASRDTKSTLTGPSQGSTPTHNQGEVHEDITTNGTSKLDRNFYLDPPLPSNVRLKPCQKEDIPNLKRLTSLLLPIPYPEKFYREILDDETTNNITLLAFWHDSTSHTSSDHGRLVGAIRCRLLSHDPYPDSKARKEGPMLYLSTLVLLSPYRGHGIASHMLKVLIRRAVNEYEVTSVGAHVWEANEEGLAWYRKRGFREVTKEPGYYQRLSPKGAVVVQRDVSVTDLAR